MPNHVTTVLSLRGPDAAVASFLSRHVVPDPDEPNAETFSLSTIIPRPAVVDTTDDGLEADWGFFALTGLAKPNRFAAHGIVLPRDYPIDVLSPLATIDHDHFRSWLEKHHPEAIEKGRAQLECFKETGHRSWYSWSAAFWGTKWDAYRYRLIDRRDGAAVIRFQTAWNVPGPCLVVLAAMHPEIEFAILSHDEGSSFAIEGTFGARSSFDGVAVYSCREGPAGPAGRTKAEADLIDAVRAKIWKIERPGEPMPKYDEDGASGAASTEQPAEKTVN